MKLVVGLGNPGKKYEGNRHNVGFMAIDKIAYDNNITINKSKFNSVYGEGRIGNEKVILMKPLTYMNNSGIAVMECKKYYDILVEDIIVICDDIDIPFGTIRIKKKGSAGTHNGLKSIIYHLRDDNFPRFKISVGKKIPQMDLADFVLSNFSNNEKEILQEEIEDVSKAVEISIESSIEEAMNLYNGRNHSLTK
ncbi:aminoacyl-tRNA hydrolase [Miniphocaeibacter massiliensis]|uniref:aminoacyl-tRNA hydrolase n=1 Tax=Miniphocaeibacter massiliensis TaxID=2041841 RepID=UPI000C1BD987|nr:aminoacyl-tRNA hydrolase [Miniphocaeibacter massiliensis]